MDCRYDLCARALGKPAALLTEVLAVGNGIRFGELPGTDAIFLYVPDSGFLLVAICNALKGLRGIVIAPGPFLPARNKSPNSRCSVFYYMNFRTFVTAFATLISSVLVAFATPSPTIDSVSVPAVGSYSASQNLDFIVNFSDSVDVLTDCGILAIPLNIGGSTVDATYLSGSGTTALVFRYTIGAGDTDADGIELASSIASTGGTIRDSGGTDAILTFTRPDTSNVLVDTTEPTLNASAPVDDATGVAVGTDIVLTFSENMSRGTGSITLDAVTGTDVTIDVSDTGLVSISGNTVTINPGVTLAYGIGYDVLIPAAAFVDAAGNTFAGISSAGTLNFRTTSLPVVGNLNGDSVAWAGAAGSVILDNAGNATISDSILDALYSGRGDWSGSTLTVQRINGSGSPDGSSKDLFTFDAGASFHIDTGADPYNGYPVGDIQLGQNSTGALYGPPDDNGNNW
ncbi:MAG: hypothetical protein JWM99_1601, partial [Verrucomicrobiales bacterium]|nr:hypothetical protein [Verrucomicrobiales bacterium]